MSVVVIVPTLNHGHTLAQLIGDLPYPLVSQVIVVDAGSSDDTVKVARTAGARVVEERDPAFGKICLAGLKSVKKEDIIGIVPGSYQYQPEELARLVNPIEEGRSDIVLGSRTLGESDPGAFPFSERLRVWGVTVFIRFAFGVHFTDLSAFCALRRETVDRLGLLPTDNFVEALRVRAVLAGCRLEEIPVRYRKVAPHPRRLASFGHTGRSSFRSIPDLWKLRPQSPPSAPKETITPKGK